MKEHDFLGGKNAIAQISRCKNVLEIDFFSSQALLLLLPVNILSLQENVKVFYFNNFDVSQQNGGVN